MPKTALSRSGQNTYAVMGECDAIMLAVYTNTCIDECRVFG